MRAMPRLDGAGPVDHFQIYALETTDRPAGFLEARGRHPAPGKRNGLGVTQVTKQLKKPVEPAGISGTCNSWTFGTGGRSETGARS